MSSIQEDLQFRAELEMMRKRGDFQDVEGPLLYAIKERVGREVNHQIRSLSSMYLNSRTENRSSLVFERSDLLTPDDFRYLNSVLSDESKKHLIISLSENISFGYRPLTDSGKFFAGAFLNTIGGEKMEGQSIDTSVGSGALMDMVCTYKPDVHSASEVYINLCHATLDNPSANLFGAEIRLSRFDITKHKQKQWDIYQGVIQNALKEFSYSPTQTVTGLKVLLNASKGLDDNFSTRYFFPILRRRIEEEGVKFLLQMQEPASKAFLAFGTPGTKTGASAISKQLHSLIRDIRPSEHMNPALKKDIFTLAVQKLCMVNTKHMDVSQITNIITMVKDDVDWEEVVKGMNARGREKLTEVFHEPEYYIHLIKLLERGNILEDQLGI